jgi:hexosaminidase
MLVAGFLVATLNLAAPSTAHAATAPRPLTDVVPAPVSAVASPGVTYAISPATVIYTDHGAAAVASYLAGLLRPATGYRLPVRDAGGTAHAGITLLLRGDTGEGDQGYRLDVTRTGIALRARSAAGLFAGVQTLRQLLPAKAASRTVQRGPWLVSGGHMSDRPRFPYRGAMLDVSRHFFTVAQVERYIDEIALYKINYFHLHLSDDQGWRIAITGWPRLTSVGGSTEVGGGPGGYYTQAQYSQIVAYARSRFITVVPEIDMPGHTNAALASYAPLNCDGVAPPLYTGTDVGFSSLCVGKTLTYQFIDTVLGQLAALTPGPYLHVGGDEAHSTVPADYATFIDRVQRIVAAHGKATLGWHDVVHATPLPSTVAEFWDTETTNPAVAAAAAHGTKLIMAPANHAYLDMKYTEDTPLGQDWAGLTEVRDAYGWNPGAYLAGVGESSVLGVEGPLWSETLVTTADIEYMAFPRLPALAELGWSPAATHDWDAFSERLAAQAPLWTVLGINFYRSPQVPWPS